MGFRNDHSIKSFRERDIQLVRTRQEILSGVRSEEQFQILRDQFRAFPDEFLQTEDYEKAAELFNDCRRKGSNTDFLICAAAANRGHAIFTTNRDFQRFRGAIDIMLFSPRTGS